MRLTLEALIVLDTIDRRGSFAAAADELHRVPSAITYTIRKLEQDLSVKLFDRSGHRARLTPAGEKLLGDGRYLLKAAWELECATKRIANGWEVMLTIAVDNMIPIEQLYPVIEEFYQKDCGTQLQLRREALGGSWNALLSGRADLVIGASNDNPSANGYSAKPLGAIEFLFAVAPEHPLAQLSDPLSEQDIQQYRVVEIADNSNPASQTTMKLNGQEILAVPDLQSKREAQLRRLGVGYLPRCLIEDDLDSGRLVAKTVNGGNHQPRAFMAWRTQQKGKALNWFIKRLQKSGLFESAIASE